MVSDPTSPPDPVVTPAPGPSVAPAPRKRSRRKIILAVVAVLAILGVIGGLIAWRATAGAADAANSFLKTTASDGPAGSWATASPAFRQTASAAEWDSFARRSGLAGYTSSSWTKREISNNIARLEGSVTTQSGATVPMTIELVKTGGKWLVQLVRVPASGFRTDASGIPPSDPATESGLGTSGAGLSSDPSVPGAATGPASSGVSGGGASWQSASPVDAPSSGWAGQNPSTAPLDGIAVPGAKVAGTCMTMLQEQAGIKFDSIQCLSGLPPRVGATTQCAISKGAQHGRMTVTVTSVDQAAHEVNFHCDAGSPM